jgi:hypothetical protein
MVLLLLTEEKSEVIFLVSEEQEEERRLKEKDEQDDVRETAEIEVRVEEGWSFWHNFGSFGQDKATELESRLLFFKFIEVGSEFGLAFKQFSGNKGMLFQLTKYADLLSGKEPNSEGEREWLLWEGMFVGEHGEGKQEIVEELITSGEFRTWDRFL